MSALERSHASQPLASAFAISGFRFGYGERSKAVLLEALQGLPAIRRFNGASGYTAISFAGFVFKLRHSGWSEGIDSLGQKRGSALSVS